MRIIAGRWKGHTIRAPAGRDVRPTADRVREAWMSMMASRIPGARVLDLFSGSGALGLEALSRGAVEVVFVERRAASAKVLKDNVSRLGPAPGEVEVVRADAFTYLDRTGLRTFDLALADPPYGRDLAAELLRRFRRRPFAHEFWVEHGSDEAVPEIPGLRSRRYGDTTLTRLAAADVEEDDEAETGTEGPAAGSAEHTIAEDAESSKTDDRPENPH